MDEATDEATGEATDGTDPTQPIGRARRQRGGVQEEPQAAFGDEFIDVENGEADFYNRLIVRDANREAASIYGKADQDVKEGLKRMGYYDGKQHSIRAGQFLITVAPSDGEGTDIAFHREPPIRTTIKRG